MKNLTNIFMIGLKTIVTIELFLVIIWSMYLLISCIW